MAAEEMKMPGINEEVKNGVGVGPNGPGAAGEAAKPTVPKKGDDVSIRYRGLSYEMAVELQYYEEEYFFWDKEVPFGEKLKIYPVNVKDYNRFMDAVSCFLLDKKTLPPNAKPEDIKKQLKMTELEYMLSKMNNSEWIMRLSKLIELTMHVENGMKCPHCGHVMSYVEYKEAATKLIQDFLEKAAKKKEAEEAENADEAETNEEEADEEKVVTNNENNEDVEETKSNEEDENPGEDLNETPVVKCPHCGGDGLYETIRYEENEQTHKLELFIDGQKIDFKDYNRLRNIVLFQNLPDYRDTSYVDPSLKKDYETRKRILGQKQGNLTATLEEKLAAIKVFEGLASYDELYKLSIRKFLIEFSKMDDLISYMLQMMGRLCGLGGGGKDAPEHWIYRELRDVYADGGYVSKDTMMERVKGIS